MTNELTITNKNKLDEILNTEIEELSFDGKTKLCFNLHNLKTQLEDVLKKVEEKQNEVYNYIIKLYPPEIDAEGKLINTQIINKETGEYTSILEYKQDVRRSLNENKALETINKATGGNCDNNIFYEPKPKTKATLEKEFIKDYGLTKEAIDDCFSDIKRGEIKVIFKGIKK